jgi:hypothetical protein
MLCPGLRRAHLGNDNFAILLGVDTAVSRLLQQTTSSNNEDCSHWMHFFHALVVRALRRFKTHSAPTHVDVEWRGAERTSGLGVVIKSDLFNWRLVISCAPDLNNP